MRRVKLGAIAALLALCGCVNVSPISMKASPGYRELVGKSYVLRQDLYLTSSAQSKEFDLGRFYPDKRFVDRTLPNTVDRRFIGTDLLGRRIEDIIPTGSKINVVDVIRTLVGHGYHTWLICEVEIDGAVKWRNVSTFFIQSEIDGNDGKLPALRSEAVKEVTK